MTKREAIENLRNKLRERNADSTFTNKFLYSVLIEHSNWLIKRDISSGRIHRNTTLFQALRCQKVVETSLIDPCCPIKTNCKIYRTKNKIPDIWTDDNGPIIKSVTSIDSPVVGTTDFYITTPTKWQDKKNDPYQKQSKQLYSFYADGYIWFPEVNPHSVTIYGFWKDDVSHLNECSEKKECVRYLDTKFTTPESLHAEMFAKALDQLTRVTKQLIEDQQIDKNTNRKN